MAAGGALETFTPTTITPDDYPCTQVLAILPPDATGASPRDGQFGPSEQSGVGANSGEPVPEMIP